MMRGSQRGLCQSANSDSEVWDEMLGVGIFNKLSGDAEAAGLRTTL